MENIKLNLPIYRARKIASSEYIIGNYIFDGVRHFILTDKGNLVQTQIDPTTLAIHFYNMVVKDSDRLIMSNLRKDLRLFASLDKMGKGGDIVRMESECEDYVAEFTTEGLSFYEYLDCKKYINSSYYKVFSMREVKIIGIME